MTDNAAQQKGSPDNTKPLITQIETEMINQFLKCLIGNDDSIYKN